MLEMMIWTTFTIASMVRISGVQISETTKCAKHNSYFENLENTVNLINTVCAMFEIMSETIFAIVSMWRITGVEIS